ncbi:MAG: shikimate kinase [Pseudomonadota bacterium]|nr:shikimate kinase [Pseudomonadota bacterium]
MNQSQNIPALPTIPRTLVLVGLMGAGKTCIGRELANRLGLPFVDADTEIETAAGCSIEDIFNMYGEVEFRAGERRVIARLMNDPVHILATGGGAFLDTKTRELVREKGISIWLRASLDLLVDRVSRRTNRPLLKDGNQREILERLMEERYPTYEQADIVVDSGREPPEITADRVVGELQNYAAPTGVEAQDS